METRISFSYIAIGEGRPSLTVESRNQQQLEGPAAAGWKHQPDCYGSAIPLLSGPDCFPVKSSMQLLTNLSPSSSQRASNAEVVRGLRRSKAGPCRICTFWQPHTGQIRETNSVWPILRTGQRREGQASGRKDHDAVATSLGNYC